MTIEGKTVQGCVMITS